MLLYKLTNWIYSLSFLSLSISFPPVCKAACDSCGQVCAGREKLEGRHGEREKNPRDSCVRGMHEHAPFAEIGKEKAERVAVVVVV